jgi:hypothetical protein
VVIYNIYSYNLYSYYSLYSLYSLYRLLKSDFTPVYNNSYKPKFLKIRLKANIKILYSILVGLVVVILYTL